MQGENHLRRRKVSEAGKKVLHAVGVRCEIMRPRDPSSKKKYAVCESDREKKVVSKVVEVCEELKVGLGGSSALYPFLRLG